MGAAQWTNVVVAQSGPFFTISGTDPGGVLRSAAGADAEALADDLIALSEPSE